MGTFEPRGDPLCWDIGSLIIGTTETKDQAKAEPERVKKLVAHYPANVSRAQVAPWDELKSRQGIVMEVLK